MALIIRMLLRAALELAHFLLFLAVVVLAFACAGTCAFSMVDGFHSVHEAMETLMYIAFAIERYDYSVLIAVQPEFGRLYVMLYLVFMGLVLLNVFIAILMDAYNEVVQDPRMGYSLGEEIAEGWVRKMDAVLFSCGMRGSVPMADLDEIVDLLGADDREEFTYSQFIQLLGKPLRRRTDSLVRQLHPDIADLPSKAVLEAQHSILGLELQQEDLKESGEVAPTTAARGVGVEAEDEEVKVHANGLGMELEEPPCKESSAQIEAYFNRYDLDGSGTINTDEECRQLLTNLLFKFDVPSSTEKVDEHVVSMMTAVHEKRVLAWDLPTFEAYFHQNRHNFR